MANLVEMTWRPFKQRNLHGPAENPAFGFLKWDEKVKIRPIKLGFAFLHTYQADQV